MFTIYANGSPLHHPNLDLEGRVVLSASLHEEINTHGSLDFTMEPNNPQWGTLRSNDPVQVRFTNERSGIWRPVWAGRVASRDQNIYGTQSVHCEGKLAYLCDSFIEPFSFRGTPADLLQALITKHNMAVGAGDPRQLTRGTVTVTDPNGNIYRYKESAQSVWSAIQDHLVKSSLGGYILLDPVTNEVGYFASYTHVCSQPVRFGRNLIDCAQVDDGTNIVNAIYAFGAQNDEEHTEPIPDAPGFNVWGGNRLHLTGSKYPLVHQASATSFGRRYGTVVFDDITEAANLETATQAVLDENWAKVFERRIDVRAIDLSVSDLDLDEITVGALVSVVPPNLWGVDKNEFSDTVQLMCVGRNIDLVSPERSVYSFGTVEATLSALVGGG